MNEAYELALKEIGVKEWKDGDNPVVLGYFKDAGFDEINNDETAWCAAFVGAMLKRAGYDTTNSLLARSYLDWGTPVELKDAQPGDVVIIPRGKSNWQGHVFFFHSRKGAFIQGLGGNQQNAVNIASFPVGEGRILGIRRPIEPVLPAKDRTVLKAASAVGAAAGLATVGLWDRIVQLFN